MAPSTEQVRHPSFLALGTFEAPHPTLSQKAKIECDIEWIA